MHARKAPPAAGVCFWTAGSGASRRGLPRGPDGRLSCAPPLAR